MLQTRTIILLAISGLLLPVIIIMLRQSDGWLRHDVMDCGHMTMHLEEMDHVARLPQLPALILGGTTARHWPEQISELGGRPVLVRSIDQLSAAAIANCFNRVVGHYRPATVVVLLDNGDLEKLETELTGDIADIANAIGRLNANMSLFVTGLLRTPARDNHRVDLLNRAIARIAASRPDVVFVDPNGSLADTTGAPDAQRFWPDGNTLATESYADLGRLIDGVMRAQPSAGDRL